MRTRSAHNWKSKSGTWDSLNVEEVDFEGDFPPPLSSPHCLPATLRPTPCNDYKAISPDALVSMFVDDYILERFWNNPRRYIDRFAVAGAVMAPDFSLLIGMPRPAQVWNVYRSRLVGYIWQKAGLNVLPTVTWSDRASFDFCFSGIAEGSPVAVSSTGCKTERQLEYFLDGYNEMKRVLKPKQIFFQCSKRARHIFADDNAVFLDGFWDNKRNKYKHGKETT